MNTDLFGNEIIKHLSIKDRFIVPPFSILDGNSSDWTERLRRWKKLNIKSEIGRNDNILFNQGLVGNQPELGTWHVECNGAKCNYKYDDCFPDLEWLAKEFNIL